MAIPKKQYRSFEDALDVINQEIAKRRGKWNLTAIAWMDFDDVSQILRIHIHKKWSQYNYNKPLSPWLNIVISNQIRNLIRNHYGNYTRPCLKCAAAEWNDGCKIYGEQCSKCPLYSHWEKNKKSAYETKLPVSLENHTQEVHSIDDESFNLLKSIDSLSKALKQVLKPTEWIVYEGICLQNKKEEDVARKLGFKTTEKNRSPGYKQIKNIKKVILLKAKKLIKAGEVDFYE
jgi:hypothetical protein